MKVFKKIIVLALSLIFIFGAFACSDGNPIETPPEPESPTITLIVQNDIITKGESNSFSVTIENAEGTHAVEFLIKDKNAQEFALYKKVNTTFVSYECKTVGEFEVKARVEIENTAYESNVEEFTVEAEGGAAFGASPLGEAPTVNIDFALDSGASPSITHKPVSKISDEYAFHKEIKSDKFVLSAKIDIIAPNGDDPYPKAGLFMKNGSTFYLIVFDARPNFTHKDVPFVSGSTGSGWGWPGTVFQTKASFRNGTARVANRLTIIRNGEEIFFLVNDEYLGDVIVTGLTGETTAGTYTMAQNATFSDYYYYAGGSSEYTTALNNVKAYRNARAGENLGLSPQGDAPSSNMSFAQDNGSTPTLEHPSLNHTSAEYAYFKTVEANKLVISAKIDIKGINGSDQYPKTGLFVKIGADFHYFAFDPRDDYSSSGLVAVKGNGGASWGWSTAPTFTTDAAWRSGASNSVRETNTLTIVRNVTLFHILVNGEYVGSYSDSTATALGVCGTFTMSHNAVYSEYYAVADTTATNDVYDLALANVEGQMIKYNGIMLGNTADLMTTKGFDLTNENASSDAHIIQTGEGDQYTYFKDVYHSTYMIKVTAGDFSAIDSDNYPKFGLLAARTANSSQIAGFSFDMNMSEGFDGEANSLTVGFSKKSNGDWDWVNLNEAPQRNNPTNNFNEYMVIREGIDFYYFINGILVGHRDDIIGISEDTLTYAGLFTMNASVTFKNYEAVTDPEEVNEILNGILSNQ